MSGPLPALQSLTHQDHRHGIVKHHRLDCEPFIVQSSNWAQQGCVQAPSAKKKKKATLSFSEGKMPDSHTSKGFWASLLDKPSPNTSKS